MKANSFRYIILVLAFFIVVANGLAQSDAKLPIGNNTTASGATQNNKNPVDPNIFFGVFALIFLVIMGIMGYNVYKLYGFEIEKFKQMKEKITIENLDKCQPDLEGMKGLSRTLMAMAIIFIVGLVLMYSLIDRGMDQASVGNLASILAGAVTTIIGFYFGTRAVEGQITPSTPPATPPQPPTKGPKIKNVSRDSGKPKDTVKISGESFGNDQKESKLLLGNKALIPTSWKDSEIEFSIPDEQAPGQTKIEVVVNGMSAKVDFNITP
jgi:hypothetical protein